MGLKACKLEPLLSSLELPLHLAAFLHFSLLQQFMNCTASVLLQFLLSLPQFSSFPIFCLLSLFHFSYSLPCNLLDSSLCHLGRHPWVDSALLRPAAILVSPDSSERHSYWPKTQLCLSKMLLDHQISAHGCSTTSCFLP